jgi:hypothetical protein
MSVDAKECSGDVMRPFFLSIAVSVPTEAKCKSGGGVVARLTKSEKQNAQILNNNRHRL